MAALIKGRSAKTVPYNLDDLTATRNHRLQQTAMNLASEAASIIYQNGAERVFIFGSVLREGRFHQGSDIDLAAEGLPAEKRFKVESRLMDVFEPAGFDFDLVIIEDLKEIGSAKARAIVQKIYQEGQCVVIG